MHSYFSGKTCQAKGRENVVEYVGGIFNNVKDKVQIEFELYISYSGYIAMSLWKHNNMIISVVVG